MEDVKKKNVLDDEYILRVKNLKKWFPIRSGVFSKITGHIKAIDGVSFDVKRGETLGVVGESGCGKSTMGRTVLRLLEPTEGEVYFENEDIAKLNPDKMRKKRREMQFIFQDPYASLNPRMTVGDIIAEPLDIQERLNSTERNKRVIEIMNLVGLNIKYIRRYPHEFSGGQRQRIGIARAIALEPKLLICDEPVSALDVSIQAQIINLMKSLQKRFGMTYIFISHDLSVVKHISDRVAVMYLGRIVEISDKKELYDNPLHPYTIALLSAIPIPDPEVKNDKIILSGDIPSPASPPNGCCFHTRCFKTKDICRDLTPELKDMGNGHYCACHFAE